MTPTEQQTPGIGLQLYTLRDLFVAGKVEETFAEVARIGYKNVELAGFYGRTPDEIKSLLDRYALRAVSTHEAFDTMESDPGAVVARARLFGYDLVAAPWLAPSHRTTEGYQAIAARLRPICERLAQDGITLMWHNHDFEFHPLPGGEMPEDVLLGSGVAAELDVYWVCHAGLRPQDLMLKYSGRMPVLHIKDMTPGEKNFTEVGTGILDLPLCARESAKHGVRYLIVEQDSNWTVSPMKSARVGFENLNRMLSA